MQRKAKSTKEKKRRMYKKYLRQVQTDYLPRKQKYERYAQLFQERNSFSKTDTDATFMRMKDDYMRNGQLKPGYNLQIATENQYVLSYELFPNPTDTKTLNPFLDSFLDRHKELPEYIVADAGYGSEENYMYINDVLHKTPLITYGSYHKENKKKYKDNPFNVRIGVILKNKTPIFAQRIVRYRSKIIVAEKIKVALFEISKSMNVRIVGTVQFVVNVRVRKIQVNNNWRYFKAECRKSF